MLNPKFPGGGGGTERNREQKESAARVDGASPDGKTPSRQQLKQRLVSVGMENNPSQSSSAETASRTAFLRHSC